MLTLKQSRRLRNALLGLLCWGIALLLFSRSSGCC